MFKKMVPLDKKKHAKLKLKSVDGFSFASKLNYSLLGGSEVAEASKTFPIVFPEKSEKGMPMLPMALLSFAKDENYFVEAGGKWTADYIPMHIKRYPFIFSTIPEKKDEFVMMLDMDAPQLNEKEGVALFNEKGDAEEIVVRAKKLLGTFQADIRKTQQVLSLLEEKDVLVSKQFKVTRGKNKTTLNGFRVVDIKKLAALDDETLAKWVRNGLMGIIYAHLNSFSNLKKVAAAQGATEKK